MRNFKKAIALILVLSFILISVTATFATGNEIKFSDVKSTAWYYTYVNKLVELKITSGIGNNKYGPSNSVTRAEFVTFLCKTKGYTQTQGDPFTDTQKSWASGYITIALANGIIDLPTDKKFRPNDAITRLEAVEMLCRALNISEDTTTKNPYLDVKTITGYTNAAYVNYLMQGSIDKNIRYFKPSDKLTRGEVASVIVNAYDYNTDKMAFLNEKITAENEKAAAEKAEKERYAAWKESVKGISAYLLNNTNGLVKPSVYDSYKHLRDVETDYLKNWGADYGMTESEFEKEMVRVGSKFVNTWYNADYNKLDTLKTDLKSILEFNDINDSLQKNLDYVKTNKFVSEGKFTTSEGMLVFADWGNPVLRGTIKYRYLKPTSSNVLNSEMVGSTGKPIKLGVWYEQDYEIRFYPESNGIKVNRMQAISGIRVSI